MGAFWVCDDERGGKFRFDALDRVAGELDVDVAIPLPEIHFTSGLFHDPSAEVLVWDEEDGSVGGGLVDDFHGISRGANHVAKGFDAAGTVDVGDDVVIFLRVCGEECFELVGGAGLFERASSVRVREDDDFAWVDDFCGLSHEVDSAESDHVGVGGFCVVGEAEGVTDVVRDVLDVAGLVIVREDDGISGFFQGENFLLEVECDRHGGEIG